MRTLVILTFALIFPLGSTAQIKTRTNKPPRNINTSQVNHSDRIYEEGETITVDEVFSLTVDSSKFVVETSDNKSVLKINFSILNRSNEARGWNTGRPLGGKLVSSDGLVYTQWDNAAESYKYGGSARDEMVHPGISIQPMDKKRMSEVFEVPTNKTYTLHIYIQKHIGGWDYDWGTLMWKVQLRPR